jgi:transposase-like protein
LSVSIRRSCVNGPSETTATEELDQFERAWDNKYLLIICSWWDNWTEIATFLKYPPEIRKIIYTTNMIESYRRQIKKGHQEKEHFPVR